MTAHQPRRIRPHATPKPVKPAKPPKPAPLAVDKYAALKYNYATLDEADREVVQEAALAIKMRQKRAAADLIEIGRHLNDVKGMLAHGKFAEWIEVEFGYGPRMVQELMAVARRFDPSEAQNEDLAVRVLAILQDKSAFNAYLEPTVIRLLAAKSVPDSAIEEVLAAAGTQEEPVSVAQTKAIIREHKALQPPRQPKPKQLAGPVAEPEPEPPTISAEYTVIAADTDLIHLTMPRGLVRKLQAGALRNQQFREAFSGDELDRLNIILSKALKGEDE